MAKQSLIEITKEKDLLVKVEWLIFNYGQDKIISIFGVVEQETEENMYVVTKFVSIENAFTEFVGEWYRKECLVHREIISLKTIRHQPPISGKKINQAMFLNLAGKLNEIFFANIYALSIKPYKVFLFSIKQSMCDEETLKSTIELYRETMGWDIKYFPDEGKEYLHEDKNIATPVNVWTLEIRFTKYLKKTQIKE